MWSARPFFDTCTVYPMARLRVCVQQVQVELSVPNHKATKYRRVLKQATCGEDLLARAIRFRAQLTKKTSSKKGRVAAQAQGYGVSKQTQRADRIFSGASRVLLVTVKRHTGAGINVQKPLLSVAVCHSVARTACRPGQESLNTKCSVVLNTK